MKKLVVIACAAMLAGACATKEDVDATVDAKFGELDEKINQALRNAATAKVDAATALKIATENEKK